jgi:hypothetical protein
MSGVSSSASPGGSDVRSSIRLSLLARRNHGRVVGMAHQHRLAGCRPARADRADRFPDDAVDQRRLAGAGRATGHDQERGVDLRQPRDEVVVKLVAHRAGGRRRGVGARQAQRKRRPARTSRRSARACGKLMDTALPKTRVKSVTAPVTASAGPACAGPKRQPSGGREQAQSGGDDDPSRPVGRRPGRVRARARGDRIRRPFRGERGGHGT